MKSKSVHAQCAAAIKAELKSIGVKASVKSSSFSMGNSVTVTVFDQTPRAIKEIKEICSKYEYGHFDGMTDSYKSDNRRDDIPQAKYVSVEHELTDAYKSELILKINARYGLAVTLDQYNKNPWSSIEFRSDFGASDFGVELCLLSTGGIDYEAHDAAEKREAEILTVLQERYGFGYFVKDGSNVYVHFYADTQRWQVGILSYSDAVSIEDDFTLPATEIAAAIATAYDEQDAYGKAETARLNAEREYYSQVITPVSIDNEKSSVVVWFPGCNKNGNAKINDKKIMDDPRKCNCEVQRTIVLKADHFDVVSNSLLVDRDYLWGAIGGVFIDTKYLAHVQKNTDEYYAIWRQHGITMVIRVVNSDTGEVFYVDTERYSYARYVGRSGEWFAEQTTTNILAQFRGVVVY